MMSWHPERREMLIRRRLNATNQVHVVTDPGAAPAPLTDYPDAVNGASFPPTKGEFFIFSRAEGGNETFRLYRQDLASRTVTPLSPEGERAGGLSWARKSDRIVYTTQPVDRNNKERKVWTAVHVMDALKPDTDRVLARLDGGGWGAFRFSEDGKRLAFVEFISVNESYIWVMDVATGKRERVTPQRNGETISYGEATFSKDGKGLFTTTDRESEFRRLVYISLTPGPERVLTGRINHAVEDYDISFDAGRIAFITNENGSDVLRFIDLATFKELPRPALVQGVIGGLTWRPNSTEVAFNIASARSAGDVFSYDIKANKVTRWTNGNNPGVNTSEFVEPRLVKWKSFDGLEISGFHYQPPASFTGKRPVIINIHGGPEAQARPGFIGRNNYFVTEMGVAMIYPNVRGSAGFGQHLLQPSKRVKRDETLKGLRAANDWIKEQPDLDASRIMIMGGSYGGYMTLACAFHFSDRIAGAPSTVGISNFITLLERTESYRRDLRRAEYGDERDPAMRAFFEKIAPVNNADKINRPVMVVRGLNDPRVPYTEAEQLGATMKKR